MKGKKESGADQLTAPINDTPAADPLAETNALLLKTNISRAARLTLRLDASAVTALLSDIESVVDGLEPELLTQVVERLLNGGDFAGELSFVQFNGGSTDAGEVTVRLDPSDRLRRLPSALRAGDLDLLIAEAERHD